MIYCKQCGSQMDESFNLCQNCGTRKGLGVSFCDKCGAVRQVGTAFCQNCGNKFEDQQAPAAQSGPTPYSQQTPAQQFQSMGQMNNSQYMPPKKFCKNCGKQIMNTDTVCPGCGANAGEGQSFCQHCGAAVPPGAVVCTSCGQSLAPTLDISAFFREFLNNFTSIFATKDIKNLLIDFGVYLVSLVTFIICLVPCLEYSVTASMTVYGVTANSGISSSTESVFKATGFGGFLFLLAFLVSVARFAPPVDKLIKSNGMIGRYYILAPGALMLLGLVFFIIATLTGAAAAGVTNAAGSYYTEYGGATVTASCHFTFGGWLLLIFSLAGIASSALSWLRKEGKINI